MLCVVTEKCGVHFVPWSRYAPFALQLRCWLAQIHEYTSLADALLQAQKSHTVSREKNKMHTTVSHALPAFSRTRRGN